MNLKLPIVIISLFGSLLPCLFAKPLKVFILAGQSNMQGHAEIRTFDYIGDDPATAPLLKNMLDRDGKPHDRVTNETPAFDSDGILKGRSVAAPVLCPEQLEAYDAWVKSFGE